MSLLPRLGRPDRIKMPRLLLTASSFRTSPQILRLYSHPILVRSATQWAGERPKEGHVVNRTDRKDVQAEASHSGMQQKKDGKEGSQGISQKDEGNFNKKAKEDHPEAPEPVIGYAFRPPGPSVII